MNDAQTNPPFIFMCRRFRRNTRGLAEASTSPGEPKARKLPGNARIRSIEGRRRQRWRDVHSAEGTVQANRRHLDSRLGNELLLPELCGNRSRTRRAWFQNSLRKYQNARPRKRYWLSQGEARAGWRVLGRYQ